jgi:hypothetical protein
MGRAEATGLLCRRGANPEAEKTNGGRALHTAADTNNTAVVTALMKDCKADPNALLLGDSSPLYLAASRGFTAVCRALLDGGANANFAMPTGGYTKHVALPAQFGPDAKTADGEQVLLKCTTACG